MNNADPQPRVMPDAGQRDARDTQPGIGRVDGDSLPVAELIELICAEQAERWRRGDRVPVEAYFQQYPQLAGDAAAAFELVYHEFLLRESQGEPAAVDEFAGRFPHLEERLRRQLALHEAFQKSTPELRPEEAHTRQLAAVGNVAADWPNLPGYAIRGELGRGGMGVVYQAFDEKLHRVVAIKVLAAPLAADGLARQRFVREARAAAAITHEHVITIHSVNDDGPIPYLVMQYVAGISLEQRLQRKGHLELKEVLRIGMQTAAGLAAAHRQGLVHRDIKPANILLENGIERVKITDFGLAKVADNVYLTQTGTIAGTPLFMSPEQACGERVDHRSDLFSLGSVLYLLCTGRLPFPGNSALAVLKRVCEDTPQPVQELNPEIPEWLAALISRLHSKEPAQRFASASEVVQLLEQRLAQLQQPGTTAPNRPQAPRPRGPLVLATLAGVLLAGGVVAHFLADHQALDVPGNKDVLPAAIPVKVAQPAAIPAQPAPPEPPRPRPVQPQLPPLQPALSLRPSTSIPSRGGWPNRALFVPQSPYLVFSNSLYNVFLWDLTKRQEARKFTKHGRFVHIWGLAVTADGQHILSGDDSGKIYLLNATTAALVRPFESHTRGIWHLGFAADGKHFASLGADGEVRRWEVETAACRVSPQKLQLREGESNAAVAHSPDATHLLLGHSSGLLQWFEVETGKTLHLWKGHEARVSAVAIAPDGERALSGATDGTIRLWDLKTHQELALLTGHVGPVWAVKWLPTGNGALSGGEDKTVRLWDLRSRQEGQRFQGHTGAVRCLDISADGQEALSMTDGPNEMALLWRLPKDTGQ